MTTTKKAEDRRERARSEPVMSTCFLCRGTGSEGRAYPAAGMGPRDEVMVWDVCVVCHGRGVIRETCVRCEAPLVWADAENELEGLVVCRKCRRAHDESGD